MTLPVVLVLAKAPVPGRVKTRLAATVGDVAAARLAEAALLDTLATCTEAFGAARCHLALAGPEPRAGTPLARLLEGWTVLPQRGACLAERILAAHRSVHALTGAAVVQVGMDTPQVSTQQLSWVGDILARHGTPVLGPAEDGGWWVLGSGSPHDLAGLERVPMSTPQTGAATWALLVTNQASRRHGPPGQVRLAPVLTDVDDAVDAEVVAAAAPATRFAEAWWSLPLRRSTTPPVAPMPGGPS